jgi:flagellar hook-associated protein 2
MSTSSTALNTPTFNGTSTFSSDLQQVISRAVSIASLPITQLQTENTALQSQATELGTISTDFTSLQSAITSLQSATGAGSLTASVADPTIASATVGAGATPGTYSLEVDSLGAYTNVLSNDGLTTVTDPTAQNITSDSSFTLSVNGVDTTITPAAPTLDSLVSAINAEPGLNVQASIVNVGSNTSPDYRLSLQSTQLGSIPIQLTSASGDLTITLVPPGGLATYKVNGIDNEISSSSRSINLAPGVTVNLLGQSAAGDPTTITVAQSPGAVSSALSSFVTAYNTTFSQLETNRGSGGGALAGQSIVSSLEESLRGVADYATGAAGVGSIADLGLTFDQNGVLSFDPTVFASAAAANPSALNAFIGDSSSSGFLQNATNVLNGVLDTTSGLLVNATNSVATSLSDNDTETTNDQNRVNALQTSLTQQISAADAAIATLQQQVNQVTSLFQAETTATNSLTGL